VIRKSWNRPNVRSPLRKKGKVCKSQGERFDKDIDGRLASRLEGENIESMKKKGGGTEIVRKKEAKVAGSFARPLKRELGKGTPGRGAVSKIFQKIHKCWLRYVTISPRGEGKPNVPVARDSSE